MKQHEIDVYIKQGMKISVTKSWFAHFIGKILAALNIKEQVEISLVITDDKSIKKINSKYRKMHKPTDVLSFSLSDAQDGKAEDSFIIPPDKINHLGEIIISYERAKVQAREYKHTVKTELFNLILHGILHLLGYDHEKRHDEKKMDAKAAEVREKISLVELSKGNQLDK